MNTKIQILLILLKTTLYAIEVKLPPVISQLKSLASTMFKWLENNLMKSNPEKSHILMGSLKTER